MDACRAISYLETDKPENVRLYQRFGFRVIESADVLGVRNWFMSRPTFLGETAQAEVPAKAVGWL
jgi:hypothetical protein